MSLSSENKTKLLIQAIKYNHGVSGSFELEVDAYEELKKYIETDEGREFMLLNDEDTFDIQVDQNIQQNDGTDNSKTYDDSGLDWSEESLNEEYGEYQRDDRQVAQSEHVERSIFN